MTHLVLQARALHQKAFNLAMLAVLGLSTAMATAQAPIDLPVAAQHLPTVRLGAGMHLIKAELAQTPKEHTIGLMFRTHMGSNDGMIFAFLQPRKQCFWMKNTLIPLAVAFVADDGHIVNLDEMQAQTENPHCSTEPVRYVLEMNKGWFSRRGIKAGDKISGPPFGPQ